MTGNNSPSILTLNDVAGLSEKVIVFASDLKTISERFETHRLKLLATAQSIYSKAINPPKITVAVLGESGAGKSTLLNALLDSLILPSSGTEVCTAGITRVRRSEISNYRVTVTYSDRNSWLDELDKIANDIQGALGESADDVESDSSPGGRNLHSVVSRRDRERVAAVYGREATANFIESGDRGALVEPDAITAALGEFEQVIEFDSIGEDFSALLRTLLTDKDGSETGGQVWPIVQDVLIEGDFSGLPSQLELVDLPGVNDPNSAREQKTLDYLENARFLLVAYNSVRPPTEQVGQILKGRQLAKKLILSGRNDSITFVATKSDGFDEDDSLFKNYDDLTLEAMAKLFVINVQKTLRNSLRGIAEDVSSESESSEEEIRLYESLVGSKQFVTSSRSYWRLKDIAAGKRVKTPPPFTALKDTQIPSLRNHLSYLAVVAGPQTLARRFKSELSDAVELMLSAAKQELAQSQLSKGENQLQLSRIIDQVAVLSRQLNEGLSNVSKSESGYLQEEISRLLDETRIEVTEAFQFSRRYRQTFATLHWATLRAACSRGGRYSSSTAGLIDLQDAVVKPIIEKLLGAWTGFFGTSLPSAVGSAKGEIERLLLNYSEEMKRVVIQLDDSDVPRILNELVESVRSSTDQSLASTTLRIEEVLQRERENLLGVARNAVAKHMQPQIYEAGAIRGTGSANRMRDLLSESAGSSFSRSYDEARSEIRGLLESSVEFLVSSIDDLVVQTTGQISNIGRLIEPQQDFDDEKLLDDLTLAVNEIERLQLDIEVRSESPQIPVDEESHSVESDEPPTEKDGSFILIDGSNIATYRDRATNKRVGSLKVLLSSVVTLKKLYPNHKVKTFVDASFRHIIPEDEKSLADELLSSGEMIQPGPRTQGAADKVILSFARDCNSLIVSNDAFRQWVDEFPFVAESGRVLNAVFDRDLGWQFLPRA